MKVDRILAVAFLVSLGLESAGEFDDAKLVDRLRQAPDKIDEDKVDAKFKALYNGLEKLGADDEITLSGGSKKGHVSKVDKAVDKAAKAAKGDTAEPKPAKAKKAKAVKEPKPAKPAKPAKPVKEAVEKDAFGFRKTSIRSKILAALSGSPKDLDAIAKEAGVKEKAAKSLLGWAQRQGFAASERTVSYTLVKKS
jgi:hypothetical protein